MQLPWRDAAAAAAAALKVSDDREDKTTETLRARADSASDADDALVKAIHDAYLEVVSGSLDRAVKRGEFVVTVVTAITTIYTGLLGVVYATAAAGTTRYLPGRALFPVVFLAFRSVSRPIT